MTEVHRHLAAACRFKAPVVPADSPPAAPRSRAPAPSSTAPEAPLLDLSPSNPFTDTTFLGHADSGSASDAAQQRSSSAAMDPFSATPLQSHTAGWAPWGAASHSSPAAASWQHSPTELPGSQWVGAQQYTAPWREPSVSPRILRLTA